MNWPERYTCRTCGQYHTGVPFSFAADFPDQYANLSKEERDSRATIGLSGHPKPANEGHLKTGQR